PAPWVKRNLIQFDLEGINFRSVNLEGAVLKGANLQRADLSAANLRYCNLRKANLSAALLRGAILVGTNLTLAMLRDSNLTNSLFWETVLARTDLRNVIGLEKARHGGPSIIDHRTFQRSGNLPIKFLRGIGLPDGIISRYATETENASYADCFISYSSIDSEFANRLYDDLQFQGVRCWYAPKDLKVGARIRQEIDNAIRSYERLIVVLSKNSIASTWVEKEVETAFDEESKDGRDILIPVRIDDSVMNSTTAWASDIRKMRNICDFSMWQDDKSYGAYKESISKLLKALKLPSKNG
ncbi:MAG: hypothetical protein B6D77_03680, partial [gamma proteobacterium symbiont of Ctena orbiculata]